MLNFKNLSEKQALLYTVVGAVVMVLIPLALLMWVQHQTGAGIFANLMENPDNLTAKHADLSAKKATLEAHLSKEKALNDELAKLRDESERYANALPDSENLEDVYKMIGDVIKSIGGLEYKSFSPVKHERKLIAKPTPPPAAPAADAATAEALPPPPPPAKDYPVDYVETVWKVEGKYQNILSFLHAVEDVNFKRFFVVSDIRMTPLVENKEDAVLDNLSAEITFICFFLIKDTKAGKAK